MRFPSGLTKEEKLLKQKYTELRNLKKILEKPVPEPKPELVPRKRPLTASEIEKEKIKKLVLAGQIKISKPKDSKNIVFRRPSTASSTASSISSNKRDDTITTTADDTSRIETRDANATKRISKYEEESMEDVAVLQFQPVKSIDYSEVAESSRRRYSSKFDRFSDRDSPDLDNE